MTYFELVTEEDLDETLAAKLLSDMEELLAQHNLSLYSSITADF